MCYCFRRAVPLFFARPKKRGMPSLTGSFPEFVLFDLISLCYVAAIGLLLLFLDIPYVHPIVHATQMGVYKYILFLTRFMGRGCTYLFLSSMLTSALWDNNTSPFFGTTTAFFCSN